MALRVLIWDHDVPSGTAVPPAELHPTSYARFADQLRAEAVRCGGVLEVSTVNPYFIDVLRNDEAILASTGIPLTAHPEWAKWHRSLTLGEFWASLQPKGR